MLHEILTMIIQILNILECCNLRAGNRGDDPSQGTALSKDYCTYFQHPSRFYLSNMNRKTSDLLLDMLTHVTTFLL